MLENLKSRLLNIMMKLICDAKRVRQKNTITKTKNCEKNIQRVAIIIIMWHVTSKIKY